MSWLRCDSCDSLIDTDENPGAYCEQRDVWLCADCRPPVADPDPGEEEQKLRAGDRRGKNSWFQGLDNSKWNLK